jgi:hypothetical protein
LGRDDDPQGKRSGHTGIGEKGSPHRNHYRPIVDGKIVEGWDNWDRLAMLEQIGAYRQPETLMLAKSA